MIVADTNLIFYLIVGGPHFEDAAAAYALDAIWCAPTLWRSEFANVLANMLRAKTMGIREAQEALHRAMNLMVPREAAVDHNRVLELSAASGKSAYDCEFVELAERLGSPVVTNDGPLLRAFPKFTVSLKDFVKR